MTDINSRNVKGTTITEVDPRFFVPEGVIDLRYITDVPPSGSNYDDAPFSDTSASGTIVISGDNKINAPSEVSVVSQTVRVAADGSLAIDVILDITGDTLTTTYEVRLTKV